MRLATYQGSDGEGRAAVVVNRNGQDEVIDLAEASGGKLHHSLIHIRGRQFHDLMKEAPHGQIAAPG